MNRRFTLIELLVVIAII
ncbi:prepilin-type N-terminal cleavage/methylation domain-containing protein, partial [Victivallis lenta]